MGLNKEREALEKQLRPPASKLEEVSFESLLETKAMIEEGGIVDPTQIRAARTWAFNMVQKGYV